MENDLESTISRLQRRLEVLRVRDLSTMGYEAKARHDQRLRKLEVAVARAQGSIAASNAAPPVPSEREVRETMSTR